jgi:alanine racemase
MQFARAAARAKMTGSMRIIRSAEAYMSTQIEAEPVETGTLTVDVAAVAANWRLLAAAAKGAECAAVIKADGYGLGLEPVMRALLKAGCKSFFVANVVEGEQARAISKDAVIYVLDGLATGAGRRLAAAGLRPVLGSLDEISEWAALGRARGKRLSAGLHFDTGMNRLGFWPSQAATAAEATRDIDAAMVMSHFVCSQWRDDPRNGTQIAAFAKIRAHFPRASASLCNSAGVFLPQQPHFDLVRPGYALYGGNPAPAMANPMRAVVRLEASILATRDVEPGQSVGYDATWTAMRPTRVAVLGVGYADGMPVSASRPAAKLRAEAIVGGARCPFIGRVSMDFVTLDVTDAPRDAAVRGASVELLGDEICVDDLALRSETIGYEILTRLGRRYARRYVGG